MASHDNLLSFTVFPLFTRSDENVVLSFAKDVARKQLSSVDLISKAFVPFTSIVQLKELPLK